MGALRETNCVFNCVFGVNVLIQEAAGGREGRREGGGGKEEGKEEEKKCSFRITRGKVGPQ